MSMSDRELLELAAKAAGYDVMRTVSGHLVVDFKIWNPLEDDGDALRLLFALQLNLEFLGGFKQVQAYRKQDARAKAYSLFGIVGYGSGTSPLPTLENVRRAIVSAAAEIGKSMQESKS